MQNTFLVAEYQNNSWEMKNNILSQKPFQTPFTNTIVPIQNAIVPLSLWRSSQIEKNKEAPEVLHSIYFLYEDLQI